MRSTAAATARSASADETANGFSTKQCLPASSTRTASSAWVGTGVASTIRTPGQLFADYCASVQVEDARVAALFGQLHDEVSAAGSVG